MDYEHILTRMIKSDVKSLIRRRFQRQVRDN